MKIQFTKKKERVTPPVVSAKRNLLLGLAATVCLWMHPCFGAILIDLDATSLTNGPLATWINTGSLPGDFTSAGTVVPEVTNVLSGRGVSFIGGTTGPNGTHYIGPIAPPPVTGTNSRTIEAWIYNPTLQPEEVVFAWGRRNGVPDGSNVSFNHGTDPAFGAVGHWGAPDIGWGGNPTTNLVSSRWTFIAYTYDVTTANISVYKDGQLANGEISVPPLITHTLSTATPPTPLPFRVARQNGGAGTPSGTGVGQLYISRVRVHDAPLSAATIQANFDAEKCTYGLCDTDNDGMPDYYEDLNGLSRNQDDAAGDLDNDGLPNLQEFQRGTLANNPDTDGDGAQDGAEVNRMDGGMPAPTNPLVADTDGDTLLDGVETDTGTYNSPADTGSDPLKYDTDDDGLADGFEVRRGSDPGNPAITIATPLINLDATGLPLGALTVWPNTGLLPGDFSSRSNTPQVTLVQNIRGTTLDGANPGGGFYIGPITPDYVTGNNGRSIEAWIYNPAAATEETIVSWGRRGGTPDGSNMSFNHGTDAAFGAVGHWGGGPDVGWGGASNVVQGRWTHVAYTYHPVSRAKTVYVDGRQANIETNAGPLLTARTILNGTNLLSFLVGSQVEANGTPTPGLRGAMTIARIRIYEAPLTAAVISNNFAIEAEEFGQDDRDGDGIPTWFERLYPFLNPNDPADAPLDQDSDGLTNLEEYQSNTLPDDADSDDDGLSDTAEVRRMDNGVPAPTNPRRADTDQDGLLDSVETDTGVFVSATDTGSDPLQPDSDSDSFPDGQEIAHYVANNDGSDPNNASITPDFEFAPPVAIINLDATGLDLGPLAQWPNTGALPGNFQAGTHVPDVTRVENAKGVTFNGIDDLYSGPVTPVYMTGTNSRTVEAWIYNPNVAPEENIFAWGRRGGNPDGSNCSFNHGTDPTFGAVGHWGAGPDVGWAGNITTGRWTYVVYTYDEISKTVKVYRDGQEANSEVITNINTYAVDSIGNGLLFRVATQNEANGSATPGLRGSMTMARIRVYDEALTLDDIAARFTSEGAFFFRCPVAQSQSLTTSQRNPLPITLSASDPQNDPLIYTIVTPPAHGTLTGTPPNLTYIPSPTDCTGSDSFTFLADDDRSDPPCDTAVATISISVMCNNCPVANSQAVSVDKGSSLVINLSYSDPDGDVLTLSISSPPAHGTFDVGSSTYTPAPGYAGPDSFTFGVDDGLCLRSGTISITVIGSDPPVCVTRVLPEECGIALNNDTNTYVISLNDADVCVILDGSGSYDPAQQPLQYWWLKDGTNVLATSAVTTNCLPLGCHSISLLVSAGKLSCRSALNLCVVTAGEAVTLCVEAVDRADVDRKNKRPLIASLKAAISSFDRGNFISGLNQLEAFENKVRAQIGRDNPAEAQALIDCVQRVMAAIDCAAVQGNGGNE